MNQINNLPAWAYIILTVIAVVIGPGVILCQTRMQLRDAQERWLREKRFEKYSTLLNLIESTFMNWTEPDQAVRNAQRYPEIISQTTQCRIIASTTAKTELREFEHAFVTWSANVRLSNDKSPEKQPPCPPVDNFKRLESALHKDMKVE